MDNEASRPPRTLAWEDEPEGKPQERGDDQADRPTLKIAPAVFDQRVTLWIPESLDWD